MTTDPRFLTTANLAPIEAHGEIVLFSARYLQTANALVWVGWGTDPLDNKNGRVERTRKLMAKCYPHIPYGLEVGNRIVDENCPLEVDREGFYTLCTSWWPRGQTYRLNYHSRRGVESPVGSKLNPATRDMDVSWPDDTWSEEAKAVAKPFMHRELNGAGWCFRIHIDRSGLVLPYGDLDFAF